MISIQKRKLDELKFFKNMDSHTRLAFSRMNICTELHLRVFVFQNGLKELEHTAKRMDGVGKATLKKMLDKAQSYEKPKEWRVRYCKKLEHFNKLALQEADTIIRQNGKIKL
jgi:hypothetical protein